METLLAGAVKIDETRQAQEPPGSRETRMATAGEKTRSLLARNSDPAGFSAQSINTSGTLCRAIR